MLVTCLQIDQQKGDLNAWIALHLCNQSIHINGVHYHSVVYMKINASRQFIG